MDNSQPLAVRIVNAKKFLLKNPNETKTCAARISNLSMETISSSIRRQSGSQCGGHNQVLDAHQIRAIHDFIRSLLAHGIQSTHDLVFSAIRSLKWHWMHHIEVDLSADSDLGGRRIVCIK